MQRAGEVFWSNLPPQPNLCKLTNRTKICLGLRCGDLGAEEEKRERLPGAPDSCLSPHLPTAGSDARSPASGAAGE